MNVTINFDGKQFPVEVLSSFEMGGKILSSVRALEGQPFVAGDKWPVRTEYATINLPAVIVWNDHTCPAHGVNILINTIGTYHFDGREMWDDIEDVCTCAVCGQEINTEGLTIEAPSLSSGSVVDLVDTSLLPINF